MFSFCNRGNFLCEQQSSPKNSKIKFDCRFLEVDQLLICIYIHMHIEIEMLTDTDKCESNAGSVGNALLTYLLIDLGQNTFYRPCNAEHKLYIITKFYKYVTSGMLRYNYIRHFRKVGYSISYTNTFLLLSVMIRNYIKSKWIIRPIFLTIFRW